MRIRETILFSLLVDPFSVLAVEVKKRPHDFNTIFPRFRNGHHKCLPNGIAHKEGEYEIRVCVFATAPAGLAVEACLYAIDDFSSLNANLPPEE